MVNTADILKYVIIAAIVFIGFYAFMTTNAIVKSTAPTSLNDTNTTLGQQWNQTQQYVDLGAGILPGCIIIFCVWILFKCFGSG